MSWHPPFQQYTQQSMSEQEYIEFIEKNKAELGLVALQGLVVFVLSILAAISSFFIELPVDPLYAMPFIPLVVHTVDNGYCKCWMVLAIGGVYKSKYSKKDCYRLLQNINTQYTNSYNRFSYFYKRYLVIFSIILCVLMLC